MWKSYLFGELQTNGLCLFNFSNVVRMADKLLIVTVNIMLTMEVKEKIINETTAEQHLIIC